MLQVNQTGSELKSSKVMGLEKNCAPKLSKSTAIKNIDYLKKSEYKSRAGLRFENKGFSPSLSPSINNLKTHCLVPT